MKKEGPHRRTVYDTSNAHAQPLKRARHYCLPEASSSSLYCVSEQGRRAGSPEIV